MHRQPPRQVEPPRSAALTRTRGSPPSQALRPEFIEQAYVSNKSKTWCRHRSPQRDKSAHGPYLVLELSCSGDRRQARRLRQQLHAARDLCSASLRSDAGRIRAAPWRGIVHRDIRPADLSGARASGVLRFRHQRACPESTRGGSPAPEGAPARARGRPRVLRGGGGGVAPSLARKRRQFLDREAARHLERGVRHRHPALRELHPLRAGKVQERKDTPSSDSKSLPPPHSACREGSSCCDPIPWDRWASAPRCITGA